MGSELLLKKIKRGGITVAVIGGIMLAFCLVSLIAFAIDGSLGTYIIPILIFIAISIPMLIFGIRNASNPMKSGLIKRNPYILHQVNNMASNILYKDRFIKLSDRCIANAKSATEISYLENVFLVYIQKQSTNLIPTGKVLMVCTAHGDIGINVYGVKKANIDELASKIAKVCPNARFGYNKEGLAYLSFMREQFSKGLVNYQGYVQNIFIQPEYMSNASRLNLLNQNVNNGYENQIDPNSYRNDYYDNNFGQNSYNQYQ